MLDFQRAARLGRLGLLLAVTVVLVSTVESAREPGVADLNGHNFWKEFEKGLYGLEQAAASQATRWQHALEQAMHPASNPADPAKPPAANAAHEAESAEESVDIHKEMADFFGGDRDDAKADGDSSEEEDGLIGFPGTMLFPSLFNNPFSSVWWKGPNVCVTREETDETPEAEAQNAARRREDKESESAEDSSSSSPEDHGTVSFGSGPSMFHFHFSSCSQTPNKYQCVTSTSNHGVHKKLVTTYRCCHGARREPGKPGCTQVEMSSLLDTARDMGGVLFARMLTSSGLDDMVALGGNATLFVPSDDAMRDFLDNILEQNRVRRALGPRPVSPVVVGDDESVPREVAVVREPEPEAAAQQAEVQESTESSEASVTNEQEAATAAARRENKVPENVGRGMRVDEVDKILEDLEDRQLILAHRVEGIVDLHDARNDAILNTTAGTTIRLNVYAGPVGRTVTANCARISADRPAVGGLVHKVDQVLRPVPRERTLASLLEEDSSLSTMRALVRMAGMMDELRKPGPLTVFFPTDEAFKKMDPKIRTELLKGEACVSSFVRHLMVRHTVCTAAAALRLRAPNMDGEYLLLERMASDDGKLTLDDVELGAHDIVASNGVLHTLTEVILPETARPVHDVLRAHNMTRWHDLLLKAGLVKDLEEIKNITMFVPTDAALRTPEAELLLSGEEGAAKEDLRNLLLYHVARPALEAEQMSNGQTLDSALEGQTLRVNLYSTIPFLAGAVASATVQCGRLESVNTRACGAVIHEVDRLLVPPSGSLMDQVDMRPELSTLREIVKASSYEEYLSATKEFPPFTLLAPTNAAFEENVDAERLLQLKSDKKHADAFMQRHILPSALCCNGVGVSSWLFTNRVNALRENVSYRIRKDGHNRVRVADAVVQQCDKMASNGIMHVVDTPLFPPKPAVEPIRVVTRRRNPNFEVFFVGK